MGSCTSHLQPETTPGAHGKYGTCKSKKAWNEDNANDSDYSLPDRAFMEVSDIDLSAKKKQKQKQEPGRGQSQTSVSPPRLHSRGTSAMSTSVFKFKINHSIETELFLWTADFRPTIANTMSSASFAAENDSASQYSTTTATPLPCNSGTSGSDRQSVPPAPHPYLAPNAVTAPAMPIKFYSSTQIWDTEMKLFAEDVMSIVNEQFIGKHFPSQFTHAMVNIIFEYSDLAQLLKHHWYPQHYLANKHKELQTKANLYLSGTVRDLIISKFNLKTIFHACSQNFRLKHPSVRAFPFQFKLFSHDIIVCPNGYRIERHAEQEMETVVAKVEVVEEDENGDGNESINAGGIAEDMIESSKHMYSTKYCTLFLIPPNINSYDGGTLIFYTKNSSSTNNTKNIDNNTIHEDIIKQRTKSEHSFDEFRVYSDDERWKWVLFDKRIEYEFTEVTNARLPLIVFKLDIDIEYKRKYMIKNENQSKQITAELHSTKDYSLFDENGKWQLPHIRDENASLPEHVNGGHSDDDNDSSVVEPQMFHSFDVFPMALIENANCNYKTSNNSNKNQNTKKTKTRTTTTKANNTKTKTKLMAKRRQQRKNEFSTDV